ncbi:hypothetical protein N7474_008207 [Penicillium riverlandense]|uniref:uncharacterized protein n=1 Tax=Penicillium riverlandense TaxID=1903569 RepID=UPI002549AC36|nr:uncharacterized protein N7474_008207 [Penicillium riverlandense]KAJ5811906.1 hypothetical protein N7474_008207 [Penicillium riverlandense]
MNFDISEDLQTHLHSLDKFIRDTILPLQHSDGNVRFFDHRREYSPRARILADEAGFYRFALPKIYGGQSHPQTNVWMSSIRFYMASHPLYGGGLGLANDLQNKHSIVGDLPDVHMIHHFGTDQQRRKLIPARISGDFRATFGLTEPNHGSDATFMSTVAKPTTEGFEIIGSKKWQTSAHNCTHLIIFARTSGKPGSAKGITAFLVPRDT